MCILYTKKTNKQKKQPKHLDLFPKAVVVALASVTQLSLLGFVQSKSLGSTLDVGGVPPVSGDPMPHGLCSSPTSRRGSAPRGCCIPCHKSTFLHNGGTEKWSVCGGSRWVGRGSPHSWISDLPQRFLQTPLLVEMLFPRGWPR